MVRKYYLDASDNYFFQVFLSFIEMISWFHDFTRICRNCFFLLRLIKMKGTHKKARAKISHMREHTISKNEPSRRYQFLCNCQRCYKLQRNDLISKICNFFRSNYVNVLRMKSKVWWHIFEAGSYVWIANSELF